MNHKNPVCTGLRSGTSQTKPCSTQMTHVASAHPHTLVHAHARKFITALGSLARRMRRCNLSTVNEGDNKVRDQESSFLAAEPEAGGGT